MDLITLSGSIPCLALIPLGTFYNGKYYINDECVSTLEEISNEITCEDSITRPLRRALGSLDIVHKDLVPILIHCSGQPSIFCTTVKLLALLTVPVECLVFSEILTHSPKSQVLYELEEFLYNAKENFLNPLAIQAILDHLRRLLENRSTSSEDNESVRHSLLLIRNIVHAPQRPIANMIETGYNKSTVPTDTADSETKEKPFCSYSHNRDYTSSYSQQNHLLWNLLTQGIGQLIIKLLSCSPQRNEVLRNTPKVLRRASKHFSFRYERVFKEGQWVEEIVELVSVLFKDQKNNLLMLKLLQTKITHARVSKPMGMSEEDISQLLKEFTADFLLNGYNTLVGQLHQQLILQQNCLPISFDKSHFLWLMTYFLRFVYELELDMENFKNIFTIDFLNYLTYEAVQETEEFERKSLESSTDLKPCLRRLHLGITAIREYLEALKTYSDINSRSRKRSLQKCEKRIALLLSHLPAIRDLRQLFILRLRLFNPAIQSRRYLCDVIATNHFLLLILGQIAQYSPDGGCFDLRHHLNQFCSQTIISRYGTALKDFKTNGTFINDCILTILHHIAIELDRVELMFEPVILHSFQKILEEEFEVCEDWDDLIQYVVHTFLHKFQKKEENFDDNPGVVLHKDSSLSEDHKNYSSGLNSRPTKQQVLDYGKSLKSLTCREYFQTSIDHLVNIGFQKQLDWIQSSLLAACSARLGTYTSQEFRSPVVCLSLKINVPCPIVPWTEVEESALRSEHFLIFLHRIGLLSPAPALYPRIPCEWSADALYSAALFFGPVDEKKVDFDLVLVSKVDLAVIDIPACLPQ